MNFLFIETSAHIKSCLKDTSDLILVTIYARIKEEQLVQSCGSYVLERVSKFDSWRNFWMKSFDHSKKMVAFDNKNIRRCSMVLVNDYYSRSALIMGCS
jgi:hypothetical protein